MTTNDAVSPLFMLAMVAPGLVLVTVAWFGKHRDLRVPARLAAWLATKWAPVVLGAVSALLTWVVWGSLNEGGVVHDERAYLLQSRIFALGRWTGEAPPIATFFEQMHVFIDPQLAAKYPPGHALTLVPGIWLGLPGIMPIVVSGLTGALIFILVRQIASGVVALTSWALWTTSFSSLQWRASYFAQTTGGLLWLVSLWALLQWRRDRAWRHLVVVVLAMAWMLITRPLTAAALGVPLAVVVLRDLGRDGNRWRQLVAAVLVAAPVLFLNFLWQERTSGHWMTNPYVEYSKTYFPFDRPGFGFDPSPAPRDVPREIASVGWQYTDLFVAHTIVRLPLILWQRTLAVLLALGYPATSFLVLLFASGVIRARGPLLFAVLSMAALQCAYLVFAHPSDWIVYYFETFPVFFAIAAIEAVRLATARFAIPRARAEALVLVALALLTPWLAGDVWMARRQNDQASAFQRHAAQVLAALPAEPSVVFVRFPPAHNFFRSIITNTPDYRTAPLWIVYDRGERNEELLERTARAAYRLDVGTWSLERLVRSADQREPVVLGVHQPVLAEHDVAVPGKVVE